MKYDIPTMTAEAVSLLKSLISIPSISREETQAADFLQNYIEAEGMQTGRKGNNVWCLSPMFDLKKPTILLNSHIDTVKPVNGRKRSPSAFNIPAPVSSSVLATSIFSSISFSL